MNVINVMQGTPEWHVWRGGGLSATTASILLGINPDKTIWRFWAELTGKVEREDLSKNPYVRRGKENEDRLRQKIEDDKGILLLPFCCEYTHNNVFRASLDGLDADNVVYELKWPSEKKWNEVNMLGERSDSYKLYYPQVQQQMLTTGSTEGRLVFGTDINGQVEYKSFVIKRDQKMIDEIIKLGMKFWNDYLKGKAPKKDKDRDYYEPVGDKAIEWELLADRAFEIDDRAQPIREQINALEVQLASIDAEFESVKSEAMNLMGDYIEGSHDGLKVRNVKRAGRIDYKEALQTLHSDTDEATLEAFRGAGSASVKITVNNKLRQDSKTPSQGAIDLASNSESMDFF